MDDPYDLTESAWRRRFARRLAEERSLARAHARAQNILASLADLTAPPIKPATRTPSPAQLNQLASARARRWAGVPADARSAFASRLVKARWEKSTPEQRHHLGVALTLARWRPPPDAKRALGGGRYR